MNEITLKYIDINGYGVGISIPREEEILDITSKYFYDMTSNVILNSALLGSVPNGNKIFNIICAEPELNIDIPELHWREWEVEQIFNEFIKTKGNIFTDKKDFIAGYNHNKAKYTEEDLLTAMELIKESILSHSFDSKNTPIKIIQSLQKVPKYIVMESETTDYYGHPNIREMIKEGIRNSLIPKLINNSDGKQQVVIKNIVY